MRLRGSARLDELVGVLLTLEERGNLAPREQHRLDREIGSASSSLSGLERIRDWLARAPSESLGTRLRRFRSGLTGLSGLLLAVGVFLGWAAAGALLSIEVHAGRINIVLAFGLLVVLPFLAWLLSMLAWAASRILGRNAGWPSLGAFVRRISVGRLALRMLPASIRQDIELVMGRMTAHGRLYGGVERGQLLVWSHVVGLGFVLGALVATFAFVVFTDLAFGWSSTLEIGADSVHRMARGLAAPWSAFWPEAVPSLELVEATRYFRAASADHIHVVDPIVYGGWWPFLVMSIAVYGLLPRLTGLLALRWTHAREIGRSIGLTPGVDRLLARLDHPFVAGQAAEAETEVGQLGADLVPEVEWVRWCADWHRQGAAVAAIRWAEILDDAAVAQAVSRDPAQGGADAAQVPRIFDAGGRRSLAEDAEAIDGVVAGGAHALLFVRGYEPPVLELLDFIGDWRRRAGDGARLCVVLVGADAGDVDTWRRKLIGLGDPGVVVARSESSKEAGRV